MSWGVRRLGGGRPSVGRGSAGRGSVGRGACGLVAFFGGFGFGGVRWVGCWLFWWVGVLSWVEGEL